MFKVADRIKESSLTAGTGSVVLNGAINGFQTFLNGIGDGNSTFYAIENESQWEVGVGTYTASTNSLSRDVVYDSSNSGNKIPLVRVSTVFCTYPAGRAILQNDQGKVSIGKEVPSYQLDVLGSGKFDAIVFGDGTVQSSSPDASLSGLIQSGVAISGWAKWYVDNQDHSATAVSGMVSSSYLPYSGAIKNTNMGAYSLIASGVTADNFTINNSAKFYGGLATNGGNLTWNDGEGTVDLTLKGGNTTTHLGQNEFVLCYNGAGAILNPGKVVYISGAQGQRPKVNLSDYSGEITSSKTLGVVNETINVGSEGFVCTFGVIENINTSGIPAGTALWLGPSGTFTANKSSAPNHLVFIGYSLKESANAGRIFVNPQNGYELEELHNVAIQNKLDGDILRYDSTSGVWKNSPFSVGSGLQVINGTLSTGGSGNFTNVLINTGTITSQSTALDISQTWNSSPTTFTAIKSNITDTASNAASLLMDLQVGGVSRLSLSKSGNLNLFWDGSKSTISRGPALVLADDANHWFSFVRYTGFVIDANYGAGIHFSSGGSAPAGSRTLSLWRDANDVLAQRRAFDTVHYAQAYRLYNKYSDVNNWERAVLDWQTTADVLRIGTEAGGSGTVRNIALVGGNVGIGTTAPSEKVIISGPTINNETRFRMSDTSYSGYLQLNPCGYSNGSLDKSNIVIFGAGNQDILFYDGTYYSYLRHSNGILSLNAPAGSFTLSNWTGTLNGKLVISAIQSAGFTPLTITSASGMIADIVSIGKYGGSAGDILKINSSGNLGISNTTPLAKLDIADTWNSNVSVTGASGTGTTATLTFSAMTTAFPVGSTIVVSSVNPSGYNGTFTVTASTTTSVSYANTTTGAYVSGGNIKQLFTALKVNVTDTSSDAGSLLCDMQVGGNTVFKVDKTGQLFIQSGSTILLKHDRGAGGGNFSVSRSLAVGVNAPVNGTSDFGASADGAYLKATLPFGWSATSNAWGGADLTLFRDAANTLALRRANTAGPTTYPQAFRLYNSVDGTDAAPGSNWERAKIAWESNVLKIGTEKLGTGSARALELQTDGTTRLTIATHGVSTFSASINVNGAIGVSSSNTVSWNSGNSYIFGNASTGSNSGTMRIVASGGTAALNFGGDTSSFPAIKRNSAALNFRLADDSADCDITAANATFSGALTATSKSFLIDHPSKPGMKLQYGSLESPYHGVRITGEGVVTSGYVKIDLPDYMCNLIKTDGINIQLTPIGHYNNMCVGEVNSQYFTVLCNSNEVSKFYWTFTAIRKDIEDLVVEIN